MNILPNTINLGKENKPYNQKDQNGEWNGWTFYIPGDSKELF